MPFTSTASNVLGRLGPGPVQPLTNGGNPFDVFSKASITAASAPNLFSTIQAVRANELERQTKQAQIAAVLQTLAVSPEQAQANKLLEIQSRLAAKGLKLTEQGIVRDESLASEFENFLNQGKIATAAVNITKAGGRLPGGVPVQQFMSSGQGQSTQVPQPTSEPTKSDLFATSANVMGVPDKYHSESGMTREANIKAKVKALENAAETAGKAEQTGSDFKDFAGQYQLALNEVINDPDLGKSIGDSTMNGAVLRTFAKAKTAFGMLPETKAFTDSIQSFATPLAKTAGEDRLTNEDIQRFTALLPNMLSNPSKTDISKMRNLLLKIKSQGGDITTIVSTFNEAGGALSEVSASVASFKEDVKKAGKSIASKSGFTIVGVRDAK